MALLGCVWQGRGVVGIQLSPSCPWCRLTSVTDDLAVATKEVLSRQEMVSQLQSQLRNEEQSTHPRER